MDTLSDFCRKGTEVAGSAWGGLVGLVRNRSALPSSSPSPATIPKASVEVITPAAKAGWMLLGQVSPWVRVAGLSGALAVSMGAYGAHGLKDVPDEQRLVFETANKYHFIHTLALLGIPLTRRPNVVGMLLVLGMAMFSGTCYVHGITGDPNIIKYTPYGGMTLILAWFSMIF